MFRIEVTSTPLVLLFFSPPLLGFCPFAHLHLPFCLKEDEASHATDKKDEWEVRTSSLVLKQLLINYLSSKAHKSTEALFARQVYLAGWVAAAANSSESTVIACRDDVDEDEVNFCLDQWMVLEKDVHAQELEAMSWSRPGIVRVNRQLGTTRALVLFFPRILNALLKNVTDPVSTFRAKVALPHPFLTISQYRNANKCSFLTQIVKAVSSIVKVINSVLV